MVSEGPLLSNTWFRVEQLRPRLAPGLRVTRHPVRDQIWYVLEDPASGRQVRLNPTAYQFAGRCDGVLSVEQLWKQLLASMRDAAPSQDEIVRLLAQLFGAGMVQFDASPHLSLLFARRAEESQRRRRSFINPLMLRLPLVDPDRWLARVEPRLRPWMQPAVLLLWALMVGLATLACVVEWPALKADGARHLASARSFVIAWLCYPVVKGLHELGHALAVRRFGGEVHEMGISLMFLTPAPYVDASSANAFADRRKRAFVSASGIVVELALAAIATFVWLAVSPGLVRDVAFVVLVLCSVSTLLFNANPLLRLDGYHVLSDLLDLPNLAQRSRAWWALVWRRIVRGASVQPELSLARGEVKWLVLYAPASFICRAALLLGLVVWIGGRSWLLGWVSALLLVGWLGSLVVRGAIRTWSTSATPSGQARAALALAVVAGATAVVLFAVPAPHTVVARGIVWPADDAQLRPQAAGFVQRILAGDGERVSIGDPVLVLADPVLEAEREKRSSQLSGLRAQQYQALLTEPARAADIEQDIERQQAELRRTEEQLAALELRSGSAGRVVFPRAGDLEGAFAARGAMLGHVVDAGRTNLRVVVAEQDVALIRDSTQRVEVRLADAPQAIHPGQRVRETPAAAHALPSAALGEGFGGPVAVNPTDKQGLQTLAPVFLLDVELPGQSVERIGLRAWVRFDLGTEPLGYRWVRGLRQLLLKQFNPVGQV